MPLNCSKTSRRNILLLQLFSIIPKQSDDSVVPALRIRPQEDRVPGSFLEFIIINKYVNQVHS